MESVPQLKRCSKCGVDYPATAEYFNKSSGSKSGLHSWCKTCCRKRALEIYYENKKDEDLQELRRARARNRLANPDTRKKVREKQNSERHDPIRGEHVRERERKSRQKRMEKSGYKERDNSKRRQQYHIRVSSVSGREKHNAAARNRRSRESGANGTHTADDIALVYRQQKGKCWWCNKVVGDTYHIDHRIPLVKGGSNSPENLCISCAECNLKKGAKMPWEFNGRLL